MSDLSRTGVFGSMDFPKLTVPEKYYQVNDSQKGRKAIVKESLYAHRLSYAMWQGKWSLDLQGQPAAEKQTGMMLISSLDQSRKEMFIYARDRSSVQRDFELNSQLCQSYFTTLNIMPMEQVYVRQKYS